MELQKDPQAKTLHFTSHVVYNLWCYTLILDGHQQEKVLRNTWTLILDEPFTNIEWECVELWLKGSLDTLVTLLDYLEASWYGVVIQLRACLKIGKLNTWGMRLW